jgi:hypothetical protein
MTGGQPGFWRSLLATVSRNPISFFAVVCVASAAWLLYVVTDRLLDVLESPQWCAKAIQAEKITPGNSFKGLESCLELLKMQLASLGTGFHIALGAFAFSLIVLVVVVVAGAKANAKLPGGLEFDVGADPNAAKRAAERAADHVAEGAEEARDEVKGNA